MEFRAGHSKLYSFFRVWVFLSTHLFYRRSYYKGIQNIPENAAIIFSPNHQSAFMDAIMASQMLKSQNRYLVRADIFKKPLARKVLTSFNLLPIYRIRDGVDSMEKNEQIFKTSEDALLRNETMIIFPEGNQADKWSLRPLKKGYARIAFGALKRAPKDLPIYIVPTGINYYNFTDYRNELVIEYGEAIDIRQFKPLLDENESKAINALKAQLSTAISPLMFDIRDKINYDDIKAVSHLLTDMRDELRLDFETRKKFFKLCGTSEDKNELKSKALEIAEQFKKDGIDTNDFRLAKNGKTPFLLLPFYHIINVLAKIINAPLMLPIENFIDKKVKDHHFYASLRFVFCNYLFPIYYLLILGLLTLIFNWGIAAVVVSGMCVLSYIGIRVRDKLRYYSKRKSISSKINDFTKFETKISSKVNELKLLIS